MANELDLLRQQAARELELDRLRDQARNELAAPVESAPANNIQKLQQQAQSEIAEDPGFFANIKKGASLGSQDLARQATILQALSKGEVPEPIPVNPSAELDLSRKGVGQFLGRTYTAGAPAIGAGLTASRLGAAAGSAIAPGAGTIVGGIGAGAVASTPIVAAQSYADAYNESRLAGQTHEQALEHAATVAKISGGANVLLSGLSAVGAKDAFLKHAAKQIPIQTAGANIENVARNVAAKEHGVDPEREILSGAKEATFGPGIMHTAQAVATKAVSGIKGATKGKTPGEPVLAHVVEETIKPKYRYDHETKTWKAAPNESKPTVMLAEDTNLSKKNASTTEMDASDLHQKMFGPRQEKPAPKFIEKMFDKFKDIRQGEFSEAGLFDKDAPIKHLKPGVTGGENKAYRAARFARNANNAVKAVYEWGRPYWDSTQGIMRINKQAPGLKSIIKLAATTPEMAKDFEVYAASRRIKSNDLIEQGREQNFTHKDVERGLALGEKHPHFEHAFNELQQFNNAQIDYLVDTNMLHPEVARIWKETDYVPFKREIEAEAGISRPSGSNKLVGQKLAVKPLEGKTKMWQVVDENGAELVRLKNKKDAEAIAEHYDAEVNPDYVGHTTKNIFESLLKNTRDFIPAGMKNQAAVETLQAATQQGAAKPIKKSEAVNAKGERRADVVHVLEEGKSKFYQVTDKPLYTALNETLNGRRDRAAWTKPFQAVKSVFSWSIVSNPPVAIAITAKDILQSGLVGKYSMGNIKGILVDLPKELAKSYMHEFGIKTDPRLADISAMGAESRYANVSPEVQMREINRWMAEVNGTKIPKDILYYPDKIRTWLDKTLTGAENANRLRKFEAAKRAGKDLATAGYESLDYMDYGKRGSGEFANILRDFVPFAGSHLSSSHTLGTELAHNKGWNLTSKKLLGVASFSAINAVQNLDDSNDPDPSNGYMSLPDYVRDNNWCIDLYKLPGGKERFENGDNRWLLIPKPWEAGQLGGSVVENLIAAYKGEEDGDDILRYIYKQCSDYLTINPLGHPIVKTAIEEYANKQFFLNMPIVPKNTEGLAPPLQYHQKTGDFAKAAGEKLNMSPARIEHIGKGILGSLADYIFMVADIAVNDKSKGDKPEKRASDKYIFNKFIKGSVLERTSYENEMYELYHQSQVAYNTLKKYEKLGKFEEATKYAEKNKDLLEKRNFADSQREMVKDFNDHMQQIKDDPNLTAEQKRVELDKVLRAKNEALYNMHKQLKGSKE